MDDTAQTGWFWVLSNHMEKRPVATLNSRKTHKKCPEHKSLLYKMIL